MFQSLRTRLLASYTAILLITLGLIGLTLLIFLATRPLPVDSIVNNLTATLLDVRVLDVLHNNARIESGTADQSVFTFLDQEAAARDVRLMIVTNRGEVRYDSAGTLSAGDTIDLTERRRLGPTPARVRPDTLFESRFHDSGGNEWIYVAQPIDLAFLNRPNTEFLAAAMPVPRPTLREVFRTFGSTFLVPLARAGALGLLIALGLSALIARSVARPLQQMGNAARQIAAGDLQQRVPVGGPREVRTLAATFNDMTAHVAATQQAQRDFLANVSHDLRTPLTSIQGFSQAISEGVTSDPESAQRAAQIIHDEAARMNRMVENLLDLARIEAGKIDMLRHAVQLSTILGTVSSSLSVKARDKGVQLHVEIPPDLPRIAGDGDRLAQVFTNLLDNAIKHTPSGGLVSLRAQPDPTGIQITVRDTGEGIPADDLPRIFERFYQVDKSRQRDPRSGMGLGLAITRQIVAAHGGTIQVASAPGQGSVFTVWLPLPAPDMSTVAARK